MLLERKAASKPITIGLIGAGKFGLMFPRRRCVRPTACTPVGVADLNTAHARSQLKLRLLAGRTICRDLHR